MLPHDRRNPLARKQEDDMKLFRYPYKYIVDVLFLVAVFTVLYIVCNI